MLAEYTIGPEFMVSVVYEPIFSSYFSCANAGPLASFFFFSLNFFFPAFSKLV